MKNASKFISAFAVSSAMLGASALAADCTSVNSIVRVKNTKIGIREYVVFDFKKPPAVPNYAVAAATGPFIQDPSGLPLSVAGSAFRRVTFTGVVWTCAIPEVLSLPRPAIADVKKLGQFEGIVTYIVGASSGATFLGSYDYSSGSLRKVVLKYRK